MAAVDPPDARRTRNRFWSSILLFVVLAGFYAATFDFRGLTDTRLNSIQTRAFVLHGDIDTARYQDDTRGFMVRRGDHRYTIYGIGISLVSAPLYLVLSRVDMRDETRQGIVAVAFVAASVVAMLWALLRVVPPRFAAAGAIVYGFGTTMWPIAAQAFFQHGPVALFQAIGLRALFSKASRAPLIAGLGFAAAATIRLAAAIPLAVIGLVYLTEGKRKTLLYIAGSIGPLAVIAVQNRWVWGSWITGGYVQFGTGFAGDMPKAAFELLFGWWRGIFIYSPVLVVAAVGWVSSLRRLTGFVERRMAALGVITMAAVVLYARKSDWTAGLHQFGYRYLLDIVPFLVVLAVWGWSRSRRVALIATPLAVLSVMTMAFGMAHSRFAWDGIESPKSFIDAPIGEAWIVFVHHPFWSIVRLLGVAAVSAVIWLIIRRIELDPEESAVAASASAGP